MSYDMRIGSDMRISLQEREDGTMSELKKNETQALADEELENVSGGLQQQKKEEKEMIMKE